jgi:1,2-dihydroxy-3-keto-5-methylthiopentene dioxygenase
MTTLTTYHAASPQQAALRTRDDALIAARLQQAGVQFERWDLRALPADADAAAILATYKKEIEQLTAAHGFTSVDAVRIQATHPDRAALREKFIEEHTHADDEVRFFVEGAGVFYLHLGDEVLQVLCEAGDVISVPAGTRHWFDMGATPNFTAIRLFVSPDGWVGHFTGDPLASAIPRWDSVVA